MPPQSIRVQTVRLVIVYEIRMRPSHVNYSIADVLLVSVIVALYCLTSRQQSEFIHLQKI